MIKSVTEQSIEDAAEILRGGGLVGMPTETVYGLAANALNGRAVAKIFEAKSRPSFNPLIIHIPTIEEAEKYVEINEAAQKLAHSFWPGPLTIVLPRREDCEISELASAGLPTLAVRIPAHPAAQKLLKACGLPLAAPSANKSGTLSPTTPEHVQKSLGDKVDMILAAGKSEVGLESTIIDLSTDTPVLLRLGGIPRQEIEDVLEREIALSTTDDHSPKAPGMLLKHYAPSIPIRTNAIDLNPGEALLAFGSDKFMGIKGGGAAKDLPEHSRANLSEEQDLYEAASNLFKMLHDLDRPEHTAIAVMAVPETGIGAAINDRLKRAAS